jgi:hypothetical protein
MHGGYEGPALKGACPDCGHDAIDGGFVIGKLRSGLKFCHPFFKCDYVTYARDVMQLGTLAGCRSRSCVC